MRACAPRTLFSVSLTPLSPLRCPRRFFRDRIAGFPPDCYFGCSRFVCFSHLRFCAGVPDIPYLERGTRAYWRASIALLFAGYATFSLLYCVQPLLPAFSTAFNVTPAQSSLSLSLTTAALALAVFVAGFVSEGWSRHKLMTASLTAVGAADDRRVDRAALASTARAAHARRARARWRARRRDGVPRGRSASGRTRSGDGSVCRRHGDRRDGRARDHRRGRGSVFVARGDRHDRRARHSVDARVSRLAAAVAPFRTASRARLFPSPHCAAQAIHATRLAAAVSARLRADGQLRHAVQLHRLPAARAAVPAESDGDRRDFRRLSDGRGCLAVVGSHGRHLRPGTRADRQLAADGMSDSHSRCCIRWRPLQPASLA